jgi:hypothetical protein
VQGDVVAWTGSPDRAGGVEPVVEIVVDRRPGSVVRLELLRRGAVKVLDVPVEQLDTMPRV